MENKLGKVISNLRKEKGITQKDLADALNVSDKAVSRWECGNSRPDLEMMFEISRYFKVSYHKLIEARIADGKKDDKDNRIVEEIVAEFQGMGKKKIRRIKYILIFSVILSLILTIAIIFTNTYNKFKVYKVHSENDSFSRIEGVYVETNIRDTLYLGDITIKNVEIKDADTISLDIYYMENGKECIIYNYSSLNNIYLESYQSYIEIDNLSEYFDNLYLRVNIIDEDNEITKYETKLEFVLDFSNNKIYYDDSFITEDLNRKSIDYNEIDIKKILLENGFEESDNNLVKNKDNVTINYYLKFNSISYNYEKSGFIYKYKFNLTKEILEVIIYDENYSIIQNYKYDVKNNKMNCIVGSCNDYKNVLKVLDENVLYLFE